MPSPGGMLLKLLPFLCGYAEINQIYQVCVHSKSGEPRLRSLALNTLQMSKIPQPSYNRYSTRGNYTHKTGAKLQSAVSSNCYYVRNCYIFIIYIFYIAVTRTGIAFLILVLFYFLKSTVNIFSTCTFKKNN